MKDVGKNECCFVPIDIYMSPRGVFSHDARELYLEFYISQRMAMPKTCLTGSVDACAIALSPSHL